MAMTVRGQHGYAMVALLVGLSIMAVVMTAAMPTWRQIAQREKEAELVFRGQQYARAVGLFQKKSGPGVLPPSLDVLVEQRFLRRKYKDPITGGDFDVMAAVQPTATTTAAGPSQAGIRPPATPPTGFLAAPTPQGGRGGIMGVVSKSKAESIRLYNGRTHYNEWQFVYVPQVQAPGGSAVGGQGRGGDLQRRPPPNQPDGGFNPRRRPPESPGMGNGTGAGTRTGDGPPRGTSQGFQTPIGLPRR